MPTTKTPIRCPWVPATDELYIAYHDEEWGLPVHDDTKLFEFLILESFQAGLSWQTILRKRHNFAKAFANFDYHQVARFTPAKAAKLMTDAGIIRNRAKIEAAINNAQKFIAVQKEFTSFSKYMWSFVNNHTINHGLQSIKDYQPTSPEAIAFAKDLKKRGFKFLGPTTVYAHMQAVGMVNDHITSCFRHKQCR
jgi:DNA-3-methyladenine glycosylase I